MIPIRDDIPTRRTSVVTIALIAACIAVFLWQIGLPAPERERAVFALGVIPAVLFGEASLRPEVAMVPPAATLITSMFLHGGLLHLGGNMLYLWIFGNNVEDAMGRGRFVAFYALCGIAAALTQALMGPGSTVPMIGASGAIGGVLGAYLLLHPRATVLVLVPIFYFIHMMHVPAYVLLGLWFVLQFVNSAMTAAAEGGGVAYGAHIGGFVAGVVLIPLFRRRGVPLLGRGGRARRRARSPWE